MPLQLDIPLILGDDNVVRYDHQSWAWMVYVLGVIKMPCFKQGKAIPRTLYVDSFNSAAFEYYEKRYNYHRPSFGHSVERDYSAVHIDMLEYRGMQCGLHEHIPLNFHSGWDNAL